MDFSNVQWLDIANRALAMIASSMLAKMDEGSTESNYVTVLLPQAVEEVYASLPLDDIAVFSELPRLADRSQQGSGYSYAYKIPESCAFIKEVVLDSEGMGWKRTKKAILTDSGSVSIRYIPLPVLPSDIPYYARSLVCVLLASRLASPVAHNENLANILRNQYDTLLARAFTLTGVTENQENWAESRFWTEDRE